MLSFCSAKFAAQVAYADEDNLQSFKIYHEDTDRLLGDAKQQPDTHRDGGVTRSLHR